MFVTEDYKNTRDEVNHLWYSIKIKQN